MSSLRNKLFRLRRQVGQGADGVEPEVQVTKVKKIVLCATQRCGSTLVCEDMRNTGMLGQPEEYFIPWDVDKVDRDWKKLLRKMVRTRSSDNGVFAVKVMASYLANIDACMATFVEPEIESPYFCHFRDLFADALWIFVMRENVGKQAISQVIAQQTGINHATGSEEDSHFAGRLMKGYRDDYNKDAAYDFRALTSKIDTITRENLLWRRFFDEWKIDPIVLRYEEVVKSFPDHLVTIAKGIGLELEGPFEQRKMVKLSNEVNRDWYRRLTGDLLSGMKEPR